MKPVYKFIQFICATILAGTPFLYGTVGEILTEKSGNLNLGVEGMMFMGGIAGLAGAFYYEKFTAVPIGGIAALIAVVCAFCCAALGALIYCFLTITLRANQNVTGLALTIFGTGFGNFFGEVLSSRAGGYVAVSAATKAVFNGNVPVLSSIPTVGKLLFSYNFAVYLAVIVAIAIALFLNRTRRGLSMRAVGENPATADAAGINVTLYKYLATCIGGGICGIGGMYIVMVTCSGVWVNNCISGYGWIAVALVIFVTWSPWRALIGSFIFGGLSVLRYYLHLGLNNAQSQLYDVVPYAATVIVLIITGIRQSREHAIPAGCGENYFREER